jgi:hypothetical protein
VDALRRCLSHANLSRPFLVLPEGQAFSIPALEEAVLNENLPRQEIRRKA